MRACFDCNLVVEAIDRLIDDAGASQLAARGRRQETIGVVCTHKLSATNNLSSAIEPHARFVFAWCIRRMKEGSNTLYSPAAKRHACDGAWCMR